MSKMSEEYARDHNFVFSTDPNPQKSKSRCIFMNGKKNDLLPKNLTVPLKLNKKNLPWVVSGISYTPRT